MTDEDAQAHAAKHVMHVVRVLREAGWGFVAVSLWRTVGDGVPHHGAGASMFDVSHALAAGVPRLADNLRVLADEMDRAHRMSGAPEVTEAYTHVVSGTTVDGRKTDGGRNT